MLKRVIIFLILILPLVNSGCKIIKSIKQLGESELGKENFLSEISFDYKRNEIIVDARLSEKSNNKKYLFDTGAPTVISVASFKEYKFPTIFPVPDLGSLLQLDSVFNRSILSLDPMLPELYIDDVIFKNVGVAVISEKERKKLDCFAPDGIIGANVMNDAIWQIDYARQILSISDDLTKLNNIKGAAQVKFKNYGPYKTPIIPVKVKGKKYWFTFDTGSAYDITISPDLLSEFTAITSDRKVEFTTRGLGTVYSEFDDKALEGAYVNLPELNIGNLKLKDYNTTALQIHSFRRHLISKKKSGNIGNKFLQNYIVTINWKNNTIYFAPQPNPLPLPTPSHFGITGRFNAEKKYIVQYLYTGSEAEKAGIKLNDEIIAINGVSTENLSNDRYCEISNYPETILPENLQEATFTIRHANNEVKTYIFRRQALFPQNMGGTSMP